MNSPQKTSEHLPASDIRLILRSMIAVAASDGHFDDQEIAMIGVVSLWVLGEPSSDHVIRELYDTMQGMDFADQVAELSGDVTPAGAELALKSATMVSLSDGHAAETEMEIIASIAHGLGVSSDRLQTCMSEARESFVQMNAAQNTLRAGLAGR